MLQNLRLGCLPVPAQLSQLSIVGSDLRSGAVIQGIEEPFYEQASRSGFVVGCSVC